MTVQVPAPVKLTVLALTVQTEGTALPKVTGFPEAPPVAVTVYVGPFTTALVGAVEVKMMACAGFVTVKLWVTWEAAR